MNELQDRGRGVFSGRPTFTLRNRCYRAAFAMAWLLLARWTPPRARRWRVLVLRLFGAEVAGNAMIYSSVRIWNPSRLRIGREAVVGPRVTLYSMDLIEIGARAVVSQGAHLCTGSHAIDSPGFELVTRPIRVGAQAWICADAFVGPGVTLGAGAVLGARGVTFRSIAGWSVHAGNPATFIRNRVGGDGAGTAP